jgi:hypothetical protein
MNERIKDIFDQACFETDYSDVQNLRETMDRFAELIVRECATAITDDDLAKDCGTFMMDSYAKGMRYSAHLIKEHFGVEE